MMAELDYRFTRRNKRKSKPVVIVGHQTIAQLLSGGTVELEACTMIPADDIFNAAPQPSPVATHKHLKTGGLYAVLFTGRMQSANWFILRADGSDVSIDMTEVVIYRSLGDGSIWVRPKSEFEDGRFEPIPAALASAGGEHAE